MKWCFPKREQRVWGFSFLSHSILFWFQWEYLLLVELLTSPEGQQRMCVSWNVDVGGTWAL